MSRAYIILAILAAAVVAEAQDLADFGQAAIGDGAADTAIVSEEGCDAALTDSYNEGLAIVSIFVVLVGSFIGAGLPAIFALGRHPAFMVLVKVRGPYMASTGASAYTTRRRRRPSRAASRPSEANPSAEPPLPPAQVGTFAGSGVVLVVGFVHMLLPAQETLTNPCLSEGWLAAYPSFAFLFAVLTIIFLQCLEYVVNSIIDDKFVEQPAPPTAVPAPCPPACAAVCEAAAAEHAHANAEAAAAEAGECVKHSVCKDEECGGRVLLGSATPAARAKTTSALVLSEASIAVHSIIIGLALGVTSSSEFTALFIAIIFHQVSRPPPTATPPARRLPVPAEICPPFVSNQLCCFCSFLA